MFEGWGAAGKGTILGKVIKNLDPRFFTSISMHRRSEDEQRQPFMARYFAEIPENGRFEFIDTAYMSELTKDKLMGNISKKDYKNRIDSVNRFERSLTDNGYLVLKFFFQISKKEQKKRLDNLLSSKETAWQVDDFDLWENEHYETCYKVYDSFLNRTNSSNRPSH
ncbi:MAG: phosphate--AMP phosphotransferase, partial [Clostridiales bacterium]|nr:phosphate--AMP phosphotransferase [Clostridiales bacterium]